jgi:hypothetical protein
MGLRSTGYFRPNFFFVDFWFFFGLFGRDLPNEPR